MEKVKDEKLIPEVNIGLVGHVAHGKTTLTEALTGKLTLTHSEELKRGITIRLGYADATFYKCTKCSRYSTSQKCPYCFSDCEILRTVSFIDAPGHETLMATVLTATSLMDGALLVIAANEKCPQPQTREHLAALEVAGIKNVVIVQNKIDLVSKERALENYQEIKNFVKNTILEDAPIIPASAQQRANIDLVIKAIEERIPTPKREEEKDLKMLVARSFDVNKPGTEIEKLVGGVLGGSIIQGKLKLGDEIEIKPGIKLGGKYKSLITKVEGLQKARRNLKEAGPGGLVGVLTTLDPCLTKSDSLVGNVVGFPERLEEAKDSLEIQVKLFERLVGAKELKEISPIKLKEELLINVGTARTLGTVTQVKKDIIELKLKIPVYAEKNERVVISRQFSGRWRLIGYGTII
ncbi:MAG: translation initiation factor IF-2 subunit gamma [Candidatus Aenigmatarchaeota archaeon]